MILEATNISLSFGGIKALNDVTVGVDSHEIVAVIGPNGAGKTALLNCISAIYRPQVGEVLLDGKSLVGARPDKVASEGIGRSFQHLELFDRLTVLENLLVARYCRGKAGTLRCALFWGLAQKEELRARERVEEVLDFFELWAYRHKPAASLPFGVQKLVGVARAMATDPRVLLLDEPGSGLTRDEKESLARFLLRLRADLGIPILWVEHDIEMVLDLADRVYVLDYGVKIAEGTPDEVAREQRVIDAYLGERVSRGGSETAELHVQAITGD